MQPISNYKDSNDKLRLLLQGPSGSGKTTVACQFPKPYIVDVDVNLGGTIRFLRNHGMQLPVAYDVLDRDEEGKDVAPMWRYQRLNKCLKEAQMDPNIETIVLDSATTFADVMIAEVLRTQNKQAISDYKDGRQFWGFFANCGRQFLGTLSQMRKHIVLVAHEKIEKTPDGSVAYPLKVAWPGQVGQNIGLFFTNVWRCEVMTIPKGMETTYRWQIRTMPDYKYELKNTLELPPVFEFKWETIAEKLK